MQDDNPSDDPRDPITEVFHLYDGIPVSSTHILVGAVLGIGIVNKAANWNLMKPFAAAWVITLPASALLAALVFVVLHALF